MIAYRVSANSGLRRVICVALLAAGSPLLVSPQAKAQSCLTDADVEAAVGDQIRAGKAAIDTSMIDGRRLCSGLTLARTIQDIAARINGTTIAAPPPRAAPEPLSAPASISRTEKAGELRAFIGKYNFTKIKGRTLLTHPATLAAFQEAGVGGPVRALLSEYQVASAIELVDGVIVDRACLPQSCDTNHYTLFISPASGAIILCVADDMAQAGQAYWYSRANRGGPVKVPGSCPERKESAPAAVRAALDDSGLAYGYDVESGSAEPSLDAFLSFSAPARCDIDGDAFWEFLGDLVKWSDPATKPMLGKVTLPASIRHLAGSPKAERTEHGLNVGVPIRGTWHGLPVMALEGHYWNGGDPGGFSIVMRAPRAQALTVLNRQGFDLPASGERIIDSDGFETTISLSQKGEQVELSCLS